MLKDLNISNPNNPNKDYQLPNSAYTLPIENYKEIILLSSNCRPLSLYQSKTNKYEVWAITEDMPQFLRICASSFHVGTLILVFCDINIPALMFHGTLNTEVLSSVLEILKHLY